MLSIVERLHNLNVTASLPADTTELIPKFRISDPRCGYPETDCGHRFSKLDHGMPPSAVIRLLSETSPQRQNGMGITAYFQFLYQSVETSLFGQKQPGRN